MTGFTKLKERKFFPAILIAVMIFSFFASTVQANAFTNVCSNIYGDCCEEETFYVTTGKGWLSKQFITLRQTKGKLKYIRPTFTGVKSKTVKQYATYRVTVRDESTGEYLYRNEVWKNASKRLKLKKKSEYSITVTPEKQYTYRYVYSSDKWTNKAIWKVKRTKNCTFCTW